MTQFQDVNQPVFRGETYIKAISISLPRNTPWQPLIATQLMRSLFALPTSITLRIVIGEKRARWSIEIAEDYAEATSRAIYSLYPGANVVVNDKQASDLSFHLFSYHGAGPFIAPHKHAVEISSFAPLQGVLSGLTNLATNELAGYELALEPITEEHYRLGESLATTSNVRWWHFLTPRSATAAAIHRLLGWDREDRFKPNVQKLINQKLNGPLMQAALRVKIRTPHHQRATYLASLLEPALATFEREGFNFLVPAQPKSFPLVLSPDEAAAFWHLPTREYDFPGIIWAPAASSSPPFEILHQSKGVLLGISRFQGRRYEARLPYRDRVTHANLIGKTRTGKSTLMHRMAQQDIGSGRGVTVIDQHGDLIEQILRTSIPERREKDVVLFDLGDREHVIGLNLLTMPESIPPGIAADHALSVIRKMFTDQWSGTRLEDSLYAALTALVSWKGATLQDVPRLFLDPVFRKQILAHVDDPVTLEYWRHEFDPLSESHQREIARPVTNRIRKFYRSENIRSIACQQASLNFQSILDEQKIFLVNLRGNLGVEGETLGALIISKLQLAAMARAATNATERRPHYVYIDEVQNFVTTSLPRLFSEAGKYGLSMVLANQYLQQLAGNTLEAVMGNVGTTLIFEVGLSDARALQRFTKPQFSDEDLLSLGRFKAVVKMQHHGRTLPAFTIENLPPLGFPDDVEKRTARIRAYSRVKYAKPRKDVDEAIKRRFQRTYPGASQPDVKQTDINEVNFFD